MPRMRDSGFLPDKYMVNITHAHRGKAAFLIMLFLLLHCLKL